MNTESVIHTLDTHTGGEPTRILHGSQTLTMDGDVSQVRDEFAASRDDLRVALLSEPRGHDGMYGAVPLRSTREEADFGLFFMNVAGYDFDMCIHATIGVVTALLETGSIPVKDAYSIETPAGLVEARPETNGLSVDAVTVRNVDSFVHDSVTLTDSSGTPIEAHVVYVGNFYALIDVGAIGEEVRIDRASTLIERGVELLEQINSEYSFTHPRSEARIPVTGVQFYGTQDGTENNLMVGRGGKIDRSPCGTGTCARMALKHHRGELDIGEAYHHEGILGTRFEGRLIDSADVGDRVEVSPEITGSAYLIGMHSYVFDPDDPLVGFSNLTSSYNESTLQLR